MLMVSLPMLAPAQGASPSAGQAPAGASASGSAEPVSGAADAKTLSGASPDSNGPAAPATAASKPSISLSLPHDLSPWTMFLGADSLVKSVMIMLVIASVL